MFNHEGIEIDPEKKLDFYYKDINAGDIRFELHNMICINLWDNSRHFIDPNKKGKEIMSIKQLMNNETYFNFIKK